MTTDPIIHTALPPNDEGHHGEYELAQILKKFEGKRLEYWFSLNFLPEVPDVDLVLYAPSVGIFACEVKSHTMSQIRSYNTSEFIRSDGKKVSHPVSQVRNGVFALRNFQVSMQRLKGEPDDAAFFQHTVIWPRITRSEWESRFKGATVKQAKSFIFKDDLASARTLVDQLASISNHPLFGTFAPLDVRGKHSGVKAFREIMTEELKRAKVSAKVQSDSFATLPATEVEANRYPYGEKQDVLFEGAAGTGKTTLLIQIGVNHARSGARVLYLCYNQALATEVRHAYQQLRMEDEMPGQIQVHDQFAFYKSLEPELLTQGYDVNVEDVIRCIKALPVDRRPVFDTVLIDESQDMSGDVFKMLKHVTHAKTSTFVAYSKGQELYGFGKYSHPSPEFLDWKKGAKKRAKNRLFRGGSLPFLAAYIAQQFGSNFDDARKFIEDKVLTKKFAVGEDQEAAQLPDQPKTLTLHYLPPAGEDFDLGVRSAILETLQEVKTAGADSSLLIVCFGDKSPTYPLVKKVLKEAKIKSHDLFEERNRAQLAPLGAVRIAKAMGCRGLTATHVLVFDYDYIETWHGYHQGAPPIGNLAYVVLSRAHVSTRVYVGSDSINTSVRFLDKVLAELRLVEVDGRRSLLT